MGLPHATAMVVGTIIGASIFVQASEITGRLPSLQGTVWVWLGCGVLTLFGALTCAELASAFPRTGGVYVFLKDTYSPGVGFLWGWAMFWSIHSGIIAAIGMVFGRYVGYFVPLGDTGIRVVAIAGILVLSAVNWLGVRQGSLIQALCTLGKIVAVAALIVLAFTLGSSLPDHFVPLAATGAVGAAGGITPAGVGAAMVAGLFAFGGWHMVTYAAGETREPQRTVPRALMLGTVIVTGCYAALNVAYLYVLPMEQVIASKRVAADMAEALVGRRGGALVSGLVVLSTFGAMSGIILTGPRVYYAMARDGLLFRWLGDLHPRFGTPHLAIGLQAVWSSVLVATGTYRELFTRVIYTEWIFFGLLALGVILWRRRPGYSPAYRVWGYPVVPALFAGSSALIVLHAIVADPRGCGIGLGIVALGIPWYRIFVRGGSARKGGSR